ncbi:MAG: HDOD domain-containing protein [Chloroflexi bacterium]|nr:HDOD domain-containing protein [Chloroflexota bacterium]MDA1147371.1 HDOD domain-containing protein [Chloroflexota bacterium]
MPQQLPVLPPARARVLTIVSTPAPDPHEVTSIVRSDPALAAAVMRAANSAWSAPRAAVRTVERAVIRIGPRETLQIVGAAVLSSTFDDLGEAGLDVDELWRHVVATALLAELLIEPDAPRDIRAAAYSAGLLHDIGRLGMAAERPEDYARVVERVRAGAPPQEAEHRAFGAAHTVRGVEAAEAWSIPTVIHSSILGHHDPPEHLSPLARATARAVQIAWRLGIGDGVQLHGGDEDESLTAEDEWVLSKIGGPDMLHARVEWFRSAMRPAASAGDRRAS